MYHPLQGVGRSRGAPSHARHARLGALCYSRAPRPPRSSPRRSSSTRSGPTITTTSAWRIVATASWSRQSPASRRRSRSTRDMPGPMRSGAPPSRISIIATKARWPRIPSGSSRRSSIARSSSGPTTRTCSACSGPSAKPIGSRNGPRSRTTPITLPARSDRCRTTTRVSRPSARKRAKSRDFTFCALETRLAGWAHRTRTGESVRELSD
jgi:hypothetical protein